MMFGLALSVGKMCESFQPRANVTPVPSCSQELQILRDSQAARGGLCTVLPRPPP